MWAGRWVVCGLWPATKNVECGVQSRRSTVDSRQSTVDNRRVLWNRGIRTLVSVFLYTVFWKHGATLVGGDKKEVVGCVGGCCGRVVSGPVGSRAVVPRGCSRHVAGSAANSVCFAERNQHPQHGPRCAARARQWRHGRCEKFLLFICQWQKRNAKKTQ